MGTTREPFKFYRWQKGKIILLASLACWIIFTLPLGFAQPPATSCILEKNGTWRLEVPEVGGRSKRSIDDKDYYQKNHDNEDENLEVAANVVFERLRRSSNDNKVINKLRIRGNRLKRTVSGADGSSSGDTTDLKYKQFVPEDTPEVDPNAKEIDFRIIAKQNRPADVLEYKRFLKVSVY